MTSRRGFLGLVGLSAAAVVGGLLGGCSAPSGPRPGGGGATAATADKLTSLPPAFPGAKPDLPGAVSTLPGVPGVSGGFTACPAAQPRHPDGDRGRRAAPGAVRLPVRPAPLHQGRHHRRRQGLSTRRGRAPAGEVP